MSLGGWLLIAFIGVPLLSALVWALVRESIIRVPMGSLGLLVVAGRSTDQALLPGNHWVPALRKRACISYPAVELSYRATTDPIVGGPVEAGGPALRVVLGDRAEAVVGYTVRFRLDPARLRVVHDRFGVSGYWSAVRDDSGAAVAATLGEPDVTLDALYPGERAALELRLRERVATALAEDGMLVTGFVLGTVDLGRAGETIQATVRSRLELAREEAAAAVQQLRVRQDADLAPYLSEVGDTALGYRQTEVLRDLAYRRETVRLAFPAPPSAAAAEPTPLVDVEPDAAGGPDSSP